MSEPATGPRDLDALSAATQRLSSMSDPREIYEFTVRSAQSILSATHCGIWIIESDPTQLRLVVQADPTATAFERVIHAGSDHPVWAAFDSGAVSINSGVSTGSTGSADSIEPTESGDAQWQSPDTVVAFPLGTYGVLAVRIADSIAINGLPSDSAADDSSTDTGPPRRVQLGRILAESVTSALERSDHEHALRVQREQLSEFVGFVSHDLKNPLNIASGHLEIARSECNGAVDSFETIETALTRMNALVEDLLELAKQGELVTDRSRVSLQRVAEQAWSVVHAPDATLDLEGDLDVLCDEDRLAQALENLFHNAIENADGPVGIRVGPIEPIETSTRSTALSGPVGFYVADDGPGIADDAYEEVLSAGYSTTGSSGIGLTIVQRIVEAHGWTVSASRSADGGARFDITDGSKPVAVPSTENNAEQ